MAETRSRPRAQAVAQAAAGRRAGEGGWPMRGHRNIQRRGAWAKARRRQGGRAGPAAASRWRRCRRPARTAAGASGDPSQTVAVTLAVHPLAGAKLSVVRWIRTRDGRRYVDVVHPDGHVFRLPVAYTDQGTPTACEAGATGKVRGSVTGFLQLAAAVAAARAHVSEAQEFDAELGRERSGRHPEQMVSYPFLRPALGERITTGQATGAVATGGPPGARRPGDAGAQALVPGGAERGEGP